MRYCFVVEVQNTTDATILGMTLKKWGYKVVAGQVAPDNSSAIPSRICNVSASVEVSAVALVQT